MRKAFALLLLACVCFAQQQPTAKKEARPIRAFLVWLAQVSGLSASSSGLKSDGVDHQGDIWSEPIEGGARQRVTFEGGYSWPVFSADDHSVIALRGGDLWSVRLGGGDPVKLAHSLAGIVSLLGVGSEGVVVLTADQIGTFLPDSGVFSPFPASKDDRDDINRLRLPVRSYDGTQLTVLGRGGGVRVDGPGQKHDVEPENAKLWQPSVSHDHKRLVYIRSDNSPR